MLKQKSDILCVLTSFSLERRKNLPGIIDRLSKQSVPADLVLWNNHPENLSIDGIDVFHGVNHIGGLYQRFVAPLLYPHKYVLFLDDDMYIGSKFCELAVEIIDKQPNALVVGGGTLFDGDLSNYYEHSLFIKNSYVKNKEPWHVDLGWLCSAMCLREHVKAAFTLKEPPPFSGSEVAFCAMHQIRNDGVILVAPWKGLEWSGYISGSERGLCSNAAFLDEKKRYVAYMCEEYKWNLNARFYPEWTEKRASTKPNFPRWEVRNGKLTTKEVSEYASVIVQPGDCMSLLFGKWWSYVYYHPINQEFRRLRPDPAKIKVGDVIHFPVEYAPQSETKRIVPYAPAFCETT